MIDVRGVTKRFGHQAVLDGVSLHVRGGELYALLGENGSGKTTLLRIVAGLYAPLEGSVTIDGLDRQRDHLAIRRFTAWLADQPFLYTNFSGESWLRMVASVYDIDPAQRERQIDELLQLFDLKKLGSKRIVHYSNGQYKKLAICSMLITNARVFLMDEPFAGEIDPPGVAAFNEILRELARGREVASIFSTQLVVQAEQIATRVGILHGGRIVAEGTPAELKERFDAATMEEVFTIVTQTPPARAKTFLESFGR